MNANLVCPNCGEKLEPDARFCENCGQPISSSPAEPAPDKAQTVALSDLPRRQGPGLQAGQVDQTMGAGGRDSVVDFASSSATIPRHSVSTGAPASSYSSPPVDGGDVPPSTALVSPAGANPSQSQPRKNRALLFALIGVGAAVICLVLAAAGGYLALKNQPSLFPQIGMLIVSPTPVDSPTVAAAFTRTAAPTQQASSTVPPLATATKAPSATTKPTDTAQPTNTSQPTSTYTAEPVEPSPTSTATTPAGPTVTPAPTKSSNPGRILFYSNYPNLAQIFIMNAVKLVPVRLTNNKARDTEAALSPDGKKIAYISTRNDVNALNCAPTKCNTELYVMNADGTGQLRLTNTLAAEESPTWSPDSKKIIFVSARDGNRELYVMNVNGSGLKRLTNTKENETQPAWSPDGKMIAYVSDKDLYPEIYTMNVDGSGAVRLTSNNANDNNPTWSPDGNKIAYSSDQEGGSQIFLMDADGKNPTRLVTSKFTDTHPRFSPDGLSLAFRRATDNAHIEIFAVHIDGSEIGAMSDATTQAVLCDWGF